VAKDVNNATEWYAKAAAHGNTKAQTELNKRDKREPVHEE
jgi:TPR repeat protein